MFKKLITNPRLLIVISAVLSALPFTFSGMFFVSWVSFVPLFYVMIKQNGNKLRQAFGYGFLFGLIYHICVYYWFVWFYPLDYAGLDDATSLILVCLAVFGISLAHGALWCIPFIVCFFVKKINKSPLFLSFAAILSIIFAQKITLLSELSFPWVRVSLGQYTATPLIQAASLFGIDGVDMIILAVNALIAVCIISPPKKRVFAAVGAIAIFVANLGFGIIRINTAHNGEPFTVMAVQASVSQEEKWSADGDVICFDAHSALTKENLTEEVDLVIWPESAVPTVYKSHKSLKKYKALSQEIDTPILAGILLKSNKKHTNNATLITKDGVIANYSKRHLVPFGEHVPYEPILTKIFPFLGQINVLSEDYIAGTGSEIMTINGGKVGNIICFESIYPEISRTTTLDGAQLLIETTNDSWLEDSPAMTQHLAHGVFRSIENGRFLVRGANSGISAVIDTRGKVKNMLPVDYCGTLTDTVYFCDETTLYTKTGDILFPICCSCFTILTIVLFVIKIKNKKSAK